MPSSAALRTWLIAPALLAALALAGCSASAPWAADPSPSATPTPVATAPQPVPNDLSTGSTRRTLQAGPLGLSIDYWSDLLMDKWTAGALKPVSMNLLATVTPDDGKSVYLQRAAMLATPMNGATALPTLAAQVDTSSVAPGYLALDPYSYSQTFTVGAVPEEATHVVLLFTYDMLVQTTPTSDQYAKQTATDTLTVAIAPTPAG
ncbi:MULTISPECIES: hypothetical protein [Microbacterium]|uniref:Lipoprotein LpqN n=1 Tax=Microbacterium saccharophilum TaxID=1213358 RepID=A0A7Z7CZP6_9MICO|nr:MULTISPECIES: hypothetical protein [Microbacterium]SFI75969.1 hypothetical protein SAMN04487751_2892 [Microbacterium saccharophilum]